MELDVRKANHASSSKTLSSSNLGPAIDFKHVENDEDGDYV
jgi:hypothetical protein